MTRAADPLVLTSARLALGRLAPPDAPFVLELLNDPEWLANIGNRGVRDSDAACAWIAKGPVASFAAHVLAEVVAIVSPPNAASIEVLRRCGLACEREPVLPEAAQPVALYACELAPANNRSPGL